MNDQYPHACKLNAKLFITSDIILQIHQLTLQLNVILIYNWRITDFLQYIVLTLIMLNFLILHGYVC